MSRQTPEHTTPPQPATTGIIFLSVGEKQKPEPEQKKKASNSDAYSSCVLFLVF